MTLPYAPLVEQLVRESHEQLVEVEAVVHGDVVPLQLEATGSNLVSFDERRAPRCVAQLTCTVPEDAATLTALDPRGDVRLRVRAGYAGRGLVDVHPLCELQLRDRVVDRPRNTMRLEGHGAESLLVDAGPERADVEISASSTWSTAYAIRDLVRARLGPSTPFVVDYPTGGSGVSHQQLGTDVWAAVETLVGIIDADVYDDGLGTWHVEPRPQLAVIAAHQLKVGGAGTIVDSSTTLSRADTGATGFYNAVDIAFRYVTDYATFDEAVLRGYAEQVDGPLGTASVPLRKLVERRDQLVTQAEADAIAASMLKRTISRGRSFRLSAVAAYWLRPGHTVTVQLPTGAQERHLLSSVVFDLSTGRMNVDSRLPVPTNASTGG